MGEAFGKVFSALTGEEGDAALGAGIGAYAQQMEGVFNLLNLALGLLLDGLVLVLEQFAVFLTWVADKLPGALTAFAQLMGHVGEFIKLAMTDPIAALTMLWEGFARWLTEGINWGGIGDYIMKALGSAFAAGKDFVIGIWTSIWGKIVEVIKDKVGWIPGDWQAAWLGCGRGDKQFDF